MLHTPRTNNYRREFCGPTAIASVTGEHINDIRDTIHQARDNIRNVAGGHMPITGMSNGDLLRTMKLLGWEVVDSFGCIFHKTMHLKFANAKPYRLREFAEQHGSDGPFIVNVTGHYVAISQNEFCDTFTMLPVDLAKAMNKKNRSGKWVQAWWKFKKIET